MIANDGRVVTPNNTTLYKKRQVMPELLTPPAVYNDIR